MRDLRFFWWALGLLFIGLKLTGHIDWSWWFVLLPFYILPICIFVIAISLWIFKDYETADAYLDRVKEQLKRR